MPRQVNNDKLIQVMSLTTGDKVKLTDGSIAEFGRLKQKNFTAMIDGKSYNVPVNMFVEVIEKIDRQAVANAKGEEIASLNKGDAFFIIRGSDALAFRFDSQNGSYITGVNPSSNVKTRMPVSMFGGKL